MSTQSTFSARTALTKPAIPSTELSHGSVDKWLVRLDDTGTLVTEHYGLNTITGKRLA